MTPDKLKSYRSICAELEDFDRFFIAACAMQENIRRGEMTVIEINKAKTAQEKLKYALTALELILNEEGLARRNGLEG